MSERISKQSFDLIRGEDVILPIRVAKKDCNGLPVVYSIAAATEIVATFTNADGTKLEKKLSESSITIVSAEGGQFQMTLDDAQTMALRVGKNQDFTVKIDFGSVSKILKFKDCLNVEDC